MSLASTLISLGIRQVFDSAGEQFIQVAERHLSDHTSTLPKALERANDRAWQAVALALGAGGFLGKLKGFFADADLKSVRDLIQEFLQRTPTGLNGVADQLKADCLSEWQILSKTDRFRLGSVSAPTLVASAAKFKRLTEPGDVAREGLQAVTRIADALVGYAPKLASVLRQTPPGGGTPLLVAAFLFFLRREIEENEALARGLTYDSLQRLTTDLAGGFGSLEKAVAGLDTRFDMLFLALNEGFDQMSDEFRSLHEKINQIIEQNNVRTSASSQLAVSVTNEREREFLRQARTKYRHLPAPMVASSDWSLLGDGLAAAGEFGDARTCHQQAMCTAGDREKEADAAFKAFRDTCEQRQWREALPLLQRAVELDAVRFKPFDMRRYEIVAILGAGGFGTVFHCRDRYRKDTNGNPAEVAIKALHIDDLARNLDEIFAEAHILSQLNHPGIIGAIDQNFGDAENQRRPYFVLEYFPAPTLEHRLREHGPLSLDDMLAVARLIAEAVHTGHQVGICHRDLKPANILIHQAPDGGWRVKVIDFGLAVRVSAAVQASSLRGGPNSALRDRSFAGTLEYAAPEQKGKITGVSVGPYSDVYGFGKTCLDALFATTEVVSEHWDELTDPRRDGVRKLIEKCIVADLKRRHQSFDGVLAGLKELDTKRVAVPVVTLAPSPTVPKQTARARPAPVVPTARRVPAPPPLPWKSSNAGGDSPPADNRVPGETLVLSVPIPATPAGRKPGELYTLTVPLPD